jgi:hypothetical protein
MKTCLLVLCLVAAGAASAAAQTTYRAPIERSQPKSQRERPAPPLPTKPVDGVIPRAVRGGNFFQMLNPKAPAKYGTSQDAVCFDPEPMNQRLAANGQTDAGKWKGIKFFVFTF